LFSMVPQRLVLYVSRSTAELDELAIRAILS
jgi:hypothetical protein